MESTAVTVEFRVLDSRLCVAKLPAGSAFPDRFGAERLYSVTSDEDEVSIVANESFVHEDAAIERGWRAIKVKGPLEFQLKGILLSLLAPLDAAGISVFVLSTYSTDYVLVKEPALEAAIEALVRAGHKRIE